MLYSVPQDLHKALVNNNWQTDDALLELSNIMDNGKERQGKIYRGGSNGDKEWGGGKTMVRRDKVRFIGVDPVETRVGWGKDNFKERLEIYSRDQEWGGEGVQGPHGQWYAVCLRKKDFFSMLMNKEKVYYLNHDILIVIKF